MKIFFIGTAEFSKIALQKLVELKAQVVGVYTKEKSEFNSDFADLKKIFTAIIKKYLKPVIAVQNHLDIHLLRKYI